MKIYINVKSLGKKKALEPVVYEVPEGIDTLRAFLAELVRIEVKKYNEKGIDKQNILFFSEEEIEEQSQVGKVSFGRIYSEKKVNEKKVIANAIQCFEDGMVRVYQNEMELEHLDGNMQIQEGDIFTLIRLTFLAGRMW